MTNDNKEEGLKIMSNNKKNTVNTSKVRLNVTDNNASGKMSAGRMPVPTGNIFTNIWQTKSVQPKVSSTSNDNKDMNNDFDLFGRLNSFGLNTNKNTHKEGIKPFDTGNQKLNNFFNDPLNEPNNNKQNKKPGLDDFDPDFEF